jgi:hypothetical protein
MRGKGLSYYAAANILIILRNRFEFIGIEYYYSCFESLFGLIFLF